MSRWRHEISPVVHGAVSGPTMKIPNVAVVTKSWTIVGREGELTISETPDRSRVKVSIRVTVEAAVGELWITLSPEGWKALDTIRWELKVDTSVAESEAAARALGGDSGELREGGTDG